MKIETGMKKVALIACMALGLGATSLAADKPVIASQKVKYSMKVAATPEGAVNLYGSLRAAAFRVCRTAAMPLLESATVTEQCRTEALSRAVSDVNIAAVTAVYLQDARMKPRAGTVTVARR
jgi:UrcA family protein